MKLNSKVQPKFLLPPFRKLNSLWLGNVQYARNAEEVYGGLMQLIDAYDFGRIKIHDITYTNDLVIPQEGSRRTGEGKKATSCIFQTSKLLLRSSRLKLLS
jgi:hypothetical protein